MFKLEKLKDKAVLTIYGYVGGAYLDFRAVNAALADVEKSGYKKLDFRLHTYGGDVFEGNLIYNFVASFRGEVDFYIDGVAASMGSIVVRSGANVYIAQNGFQMIHAPKGGTFGTAKQHIQNAKLLRSMEKNFRTNLVACTGKTEEDVDKWFDGTDYWFDADECVSLGLATGKFSPKVNNIITLDKSEAMQIGAEAVYHRFAASLVKTDNNPKNLKMDKTQIIARYGLTGVTSESTDEQVLAALDAKNKKEKDDALQAESDKAKAAAKVVIEAAVDKAIDDKKITKEQREKYIARGEKLGIEELNAVLEDIKPYKPVSEHIKGGKSGEASKDREGWAWKDYQEKATAELEEMPKKDPEKFKALYKAEYGVEPEL